MSQKWSISTWKWWPALWRYGGQYSVTNCRCDVGLSVRCFHLPLIFEDRCSKIDGRWSMRRSMVEDRWSMVEDRWSMVDGRWSKIDDRRSMCRPSKIDGRWSMIDDRRSMCLPSEIDTIIIALNGRGTHLCKQNLINLVWSVPYCIYDVEQWVLSHWEIHNYNLISSMAKNPV